MNHAAGRYKGRGIVGSEQYGTTKNGNDQIVVDLDIPELGATLSTFLVFTDAAAQYSIDRLRALGWEGDDLSNLAGIDRNEVDIDIKYEMFECKQKMKVEIVTGGGRVTLQQPMNDSGKRAFAARFNKLAVVSPGSPKSADADPAGFPFGHNQKQASGVKL